MRIGIDAREIERGVTTGIGRALQILLKGVGAAGCHHDIYLFSTRPLQELESRTCIQIVCGALKRQTLLWDQITLPILLFRHRIDVFLSPYYKVPFLAKCKTFSTMYDLISLRCHVYQGERKSVKSILFRSVASLYARKAHAIITCSNYSKQDIMNCFHLPQSKIHRIYLGLSSQYTSIPGDTTPNLTPYHITGRFLLCVGNFKPHKNVQTLIAAFRTVARARPDLQLVLAGPPDAFLPEILEENSDLVGCRQLIATGAIPQRVQNILYRCASALVFPSYYEGFGYPALEAMACGCPVICSNTSSLPEIVGNAGLLFSPDDRATLIKHILSVLDQPNLALKMKESGIRQASIFNEDCYVRTMVGLFENTHNSQDNRLFVTCDYAPIIGGQSTYFTNLWQNLSPEHDRFLLPAICRPYVPRTCASFFHLSRGEWWLPRLNRAFTILRAVLVHIAFHRPHEIHAGQLVSCGIAALVAQRIFSVPYVLYIFGSDILEFSRSPWQRAILRSIISHSRLVVTISRFTQDAILNICNSANISIVAPGVEDRFFTHDKGTTRTLKAKLGLEDTFVFLTVGRLVRRKGHDVVIRALPRVLQSVPGVMYFIAGDGPCRNELLRLAENLNVMSHVRWTGSVSNTELPSCYHLADVFIMTSRVIEQQGDAEGYGIVYLEANAAGVPVIAGRCGGSVDAVRENVSGLFVDDPTNPDHVADAMVRLAMDMALRQHISEGGRCWAKESVWELRRAQWNQALTHRIHG